MSNKNVILGCNGQVGRALKDVFPEATCLSHKDLDIANRRQVEGFDWSSYDTIINAAAYVNADDSETPEGRRKTWRVNADGPRNLAAVALRLDKQLVHYSSEYVFDGSRDSHTEDEPVSPLSVYGQAKAAADLAVSLVPNHYILRVSWVVGDGHNFPKTMKRLADMRIDPKVVNDQFGRLTFASEIARATKHLLNISAEPGIYNLSNSGPIKSWYEIATDVFRYAGHDTDRVHAISTAEYASGKDFFAPRPVHSDFDLTKIQKTGFEPQDYTPMLKEYISSLPETN